MKKTTAIKKQLFFLLCTLIPLSTYLYEKKKSRSLDLLFNKNYQPFFNCNLNKINENFLIDTGGAFCCCINDSLLVHFPKRELYKNSQLENFQGLVTTRSEYLLKKAKLFNVKFSPFLITPICRESWAKENTLTGLAESSIEDKKTISPLSPTSLIGHRLLAGMNFTLDFQKNKFRSYQRGLIPLFHFPYGHLFKPEKISFEYDNKRGLLIWIDTTYGRKRFLIDTGATLTILKPDPVFTPDATQKTPEYLPELHLTKFVIGSKDYGPKQAFIVDSLVTDKIDGVLGMDFFYDKVIYFDMEDHYICIKNY